MFLESCETCVSCNELGGFRPFVKTFRKKVSKKPVKRIVKKPVAGSPYEIKLSKLQSRLNYLRKRKCKSSRCKSHRRRDIILVTQQITELKMQKMSIEQLEIEAKKIKSRITYNVNRKCKSRKCEDNRMAEIRSLKKFMSEAQKQVSDKRHRKFKKKRAQDTAKIKKVAAVAALAVGAYYAAPYIQAGMAKIGVGKTSALAVGKKVGEKVLPVIKPKPTATLTDIGTDIATTIAKKEGYDLTSPTAQSLLKDYMVVEQKKLQDKVKRAQYLPLPKAPLMLTPEARAQQIQPKPTIGKILPWVAIPMLFMMG